MSAPNQPLAQLSPTAGRTFAPAAGTHPDPVKSTDLLKGQKGVEIEHNGAVYRLQTTKLGKLILTK